MKSLAILVVVAGCTDRAPAINPNETVVEPMTQAPSRPEDHPSEEKAGYVGVLAPRESAEVLAPFTSTIAELEVKLGDRVDHGSSLGRLDDRPLREELAIANASLKESQAKVSQAYVEKRAAHAALDREQRALKENVVSKADVIAASFKDREAGTAEAGAAASVEEERAKIAKLQAKLTDTSMLAPLAGRVALIYAQPGERVEEGHPVIRVISSDELYVKFAIPADHGKLSPGDEIDIVIEQQGVRVPGVVKHVAPELDPVAQMILADAEFTTPPAQLQSGTVCRIIPRDKAKR